MWHHANQVMVETRGPLPNCAIAAPRANRHTRQAGKAMGASRNMRSSLLLVGVSNWSERGRDEPADHNTKTPITGVLLAIPLASTRQQMP